MRHPEPDPNEDPWVIGAPPPEQVVLTPYQPEWVDRFNTVAAGIRSALGATVLALEHVGSTSVPGLPAKDIIDIDLTVADSTDEARYVPQLEAVGYVLFVRERSFHEHRMFRYDAPRVNLHVWSPDCPEVIRHSMFRDWLRAHPEDRDRYAQAKRNAIPGGGNVMDYNGRKQAVIREIYARMFQAAGFTS